MVNFALKTAFSDEDQKDIVVTGLDPGYSYFLLSLRAVVQVVRRQQRPVDMWDTEQQLSLSLTAGAAR